MKTNKINVVLSLNKTQIQQIQAYQSCYEESKINDNAWSYQNKASSDKTYFTYKTYMFLGTMPDPGVDVGGAFGGGASKIG